MGLLEQLLATALISGAIGVLIGLTKGREFAEPEKEGKLNLVNTKK